MSIKCRFCFNLSNLFFFLWARLFRRNTARAPAYIHEPHDVRLMDIRLRKAAISAFHVAYTPLFLLCGRFSFRPHAFSGRTNVEFGEGQKWWDDAQNNSIFTKYGRVRPVSLSALGETAWKQGDWDRLDGA